MPIDPSIAMGIKPIQIPDPLAQYGQLAAIQNAQNQGRAAQNQNALAQYTIAKAQREDTAADAINAFVAQSTDKTTGKLDRNLLVQKVQEAGLGSQLLKLQDMFTKQDTEATTLAKTKGEVEAARFKLLKDKKDFITSTQRDISRNPSDANIVAWHEDLIANPLFSAEEKSQLSAGAQRMLNMSVPERQTFLASQGATASDLKPTLTNQGLGGTERVLTTPAFGGAATVVPGSVGTRTATPGEMMTNTVAQANLAVNQGRLKLEQEKAVQPVFNAQAGGFVAPPTKENPQGKFIPATEIQQVKDQQAAIKALKSAGYDPTTGKDTISNLIEKSTSGGLEAGSAATLAFVFGTSTEGRKAIAALEGTANQIATDLAGGKLGAGISNTDRDFIVSALGDVSNAMKPAGERLAGWNAAKQRMINTGLIPAPNAAGQGNAVDTSNPLLK